MKIIIYILALATLIIAILLAKNHFIVAIIMTYIAGLAIGTTFDGHKP